MPWGDAMNGWNAAEADVQFASPVLAISKLDAMNTSSCEVEAYVKASGIHAAISLLSNVIGPLTTDDLSVNELQVYEYEGVKVRLQQSEDGFISVWVSGSELWPSSLAFGRHLAAELFCGGCAEFCVDGESTAGVSPHVRKYNDNQEARSTRRTAGQSAGRLQEA